MWNRKILIASVILFCGSSFAHAQLSIDECYEKARNNYPLIKRYELIEKTRDYNLSNAGKGYLPQFSVSAKATYQSEVTSIPINVPIPGLDMPVLPKDQYAATATANQLIWDGGNIKAKKDITKASTEVDKRQLDVDMYTIKDRVNQMFFGVLLLDAKIKQNELLQDELQRNYDRINSYMQNGIANQADIDAIKVEQVKAVQNKVQLETSRRSYKEMLSALIGESIGEQTALAKPQVQDILPTQPTNRLELQLFDAQYRNFDEQRKSIKASYMPQLSAFITAGGGRPGLNMLNPNFSPYYITGVNLSWNLGSLYTKKNNLKLIDTNQHNVDIQRETFLFNTHLEMTQEQQEINKNKDMLKYDDEIIRLRNSVRKSTEIKVEHGTSTVVDLMNDLNAEDTARQDKIQHEIQMLQAIYNMKYTTNN